MGNKPGCGGCETREKEIEQKVVVSTLNYPKLIKSIRTEKH